jgi:signal transduction histidine kinase
LDKLFEPFVRGTQGGTGIGLAIVAKIVAVYAGTIRAVNRGGACFELTLRDAGSASPAPGGAGSA